MRERCVVGIDVGAPRKGFHAVALRDGRGNYKAYGDVTGGFIIVPPARLPAKRSC